MQIRWSPAAAEDFFRIVEYIRQENPPAAERIAKTIYESWFAEDFSLSWQDRPRRRHARIAPAVAAFRGGLPGRERCGGNSERNTRSAEMAAEGLKDGEPRRKPNSLCCLSPLGS